MIFVMEKQKNGDKYEGLPIKSVDPSAMGSDGILTIALNLRGVEILTDFYEDPDYVRKLFDFICEADIKRIKAFRKRVNQPEKSDNFWFADDSIANISKEMFKEFVLPFHRKLMSELTTNGKYNGMHLCGDATRHFKMIADEFGVKSFDTGFPVDFGWIRNELGEGIEICGGPNISLLLNGSPSDVAKEAERILKSGIMKGGKFVLKEGNNLAPRTPMENIASMYETCKKYGIYK